MTRDEWIKRYVARMLACGSSQTEQQLIASAELACDATEAMGRNDPAHWEDPEVIADEHLENE